MNIIVGKSNGNLKYGCALCNACQPYLEDGKLYCIGDSKELFKVMIILKSVINNGFIFLEVHGVWW